MSDLEAGIAMDQMINSLLSECFWGYFLHPEKPKELRVLEDWVPIRGSSPSYSPPNSQSVDDVCSDRMLLTLAEYLEFHTSMSRGERKAVKTRFTEAGHIGGCFREYYDAAKRKLTISQEMLDYVSKQSDGEPSLFRGGAVHILPSFFRLVEVLCSRHIEFRLVFRTFGTDIANVAREFNYFCSGKHPLCPLAHPIDGTDSSIDRRLHFPAATGRLRRASSDSDGIFLACVDTDQTVQIVSGAEAFQAQLNSWACHGYCTAAIRDDYFWWRDFSESDESGKLLIVDESNSTDIQIFFDDNIERHCAHIVDVRRQSDFSCVPFEESNGKFLCRVEPFFAIVNRNYFVDKLDEMLTRIR